ncbi:hypothetical protein HA402_001471 [Bradysia odoriphaga]|nr:hypothetical protein HA402_001471 [Bradysia odoriphaga]
MSVKARIHANHTLTFVQIMPQMLNHLKDIGLDWGVMNVYTCEKSCSSSGYIREFVYKQDIVQESQ